MTTAAVLPESNMLRNLQQISEARGLKFYVNPPPDVVPEFLGDLRPDAIARGPQGGIVITVKRREPRMPTNGSLTSPSVFPLRRDGNFRRSTSFPRPTRRPPSRNRPSHSFVRRSNRSKH